MEEDEQPEESGLLIFRRSVAAAAVALSQLAGGVQVSVSGRLQQFPEIPLPFSREIRQALKKLRVKIYRDRVLLLRKQVSVLLLTPFSFAFLFC